MSDDRIKEILYGEISRIGEDRILETISMGRSRKVIGRVVSAVRSAYGESDEADAVTATALLHYLLTVCLVPSQRKVEYGGEEVDIVIPDMRTLLDRPQDALVILVRAAGVPDVSELQPLAENVWTVSARPAVGARRFAVGGDRSGGGAEDFADMLDRIREFVGSRRSTGLKILRI